MEIYWERRRRKRGERQEREALEKKFDCKLSPSGVTRALQRLYPGLSMRKRGRPRNDKEETQHNSCGGFELIVALAYHLGWPQIVAEVVNDSIASLKRTKTYRESHNNSDMEGRDERGRFTSEYSLRFIKNNRGNSSKNSKKTIKP
ncbi:hypothetical protein LCGC14_2228070 [marine sediment metagenome]|uniref:Uncharacterized protein n=1 Tax=marine sediment metagenome TaxID=412755 RepID=A0A0F9FLK0_9ZZZZ